MLTRKEKTPRRATYSNPLANLAARHLVPPPVAPLAAPAFILLLLLPPLVLEPLGDDGVFVVGRLHDVFDAGAQDVGDAACREGEKGEISFRPFCPLSPASQEKCNKKEGKKKKKKNTPLPVRATLPPPPAIPLLFAGGGAVTSWFLRATSGCLGSLCFMFPLPPRPVV